MRVLFTAYPVRSNFLYLAPLAWALRAAGHDVCFASQPRFADTITQAGLTAVPVGRNTDHVRLLVAAGLSPDFVEENRAGMGGPPYDVLDDPEGASWERLRDDQIGLVEGWHKPLDFPMIAQLVEFTRHWRPDLVIWEPTTCAGAIAAKACGVAHARLLWSVDLFGQLRELFLTVKATQPPERRTDPLADWLASYGRKYGFTFTEDMICGQVTINQLPRSLQTEANLPYLRMQHIPYAGPAVVPDWLRQPPTRPRIALTMGLTSTQFYSGYPVDMQAIIDGLGTIDVEVVANVARSEQRKLARVPRNVRLVHFVPWPALVPSCAVVIHHAGAATLATTSRHPVPQLALYYESDQPILARKLADHGAGLAIHTSEATGEAVRDAVLRLLHEPAFRDRAAALRDEIRSLPSPGQLVPRLEELAAAHRRTG